MIEIFESLLRVALVAGLLWFGWAVWSMLAGNGSPLRAGNGSEARECLGCGSDLQRVDVVNCSKCLGV
jgi:hypothetical protein